MRKVAIILAVEMYGATQISKVKYAGADAKDFSIALQLHGFTPSDQTLLIDAAATKTSIESKVRRVVASLTAEDTLYFYYVGHGFAQNAQNYMTCADTDLNDLIHTSISIKWILEQFKTSASKKIALFLDACERGMLDRSNLRSIYSDFTENELTNFFNREEHCVCFIACRPGQNSYAVDGLGHGIWAYHLSEALKAEPVSALENGSLLTAASLQNYLQVEVPRTLRQAHTDTVVQTPCMYGAQKSNFLIAEVSESSTVSRQKKTVTPSAMQFKRIVLFREQAQSVKRLAGFKKTHRIPESATGSAAKFIIDLALPELEQDVDSIRDGLKAAFNFKRKDMTAGAGDGKGSILTPYFDYEITVSINPKDTSELIWRREIINIREPEKVLSEIFDKVFKGTFDTLEFESNNTITAIIDQVEDLDNSDISISYDKDCTACRIKIKGCDAEIIITPSTFRIIHAGAVSPRQLISAFFEAQKQLVNSHEIKALLTNFQ